MKLFLISCLVALAAADVSHEVWGPEHDARILRSDLHRALDSYKYSYETSNNIAVEEHGQIKGTGAAEGMAAQGQFRYNSPTGEHFSLQYTADENGFLPQGDHLPTPPPIPEAIMRGLEYNRAHPFQSEN